MEPPLIKNHSRSPSQAEEGGEVGWWVFPVLTSSSQGFMII